MQNSPFLNRSVAAYHFCGLKRPVPTLCEPALEGGAKDNVHDNTDATTIADFDSAWKRELNLWLPDWVEQRIQQADAVVLQRWAINVLTADALDAVFSG